MVCPRSGGPAASALFIVDDQPQRRLVPATFLHLLNEDECQSLGVFAGFRDAMAITDLVEDLLKQGDFVPPSEAGL